jgi:hypothetical protein
MQQLKIFFDKTSLAVSLFIHTIISIIKVVAVSKWRVSPLPQAKRETCIILGNGPSLKRTLQENIGIIQQHDCICVNNFSVSDYYGQVKPKYYMMLDHMFWKVEKNEPLFADIRKAFHNMQNKTDWQMYLMLPQQAKKSSFIQEVLQQNNHIVPVYFNYTVFNGFDWAAYPFYHLQLAMPQSQNVLVAAVFKMIMTGYKKIIILGGDHSWHKNLSVNEDNVVGIVNEHFYEGLRDHKFSPEYKNLLTKEFFTIAELFTAWAKVHVGHHKMNKFARWKGAIVLNATPGSCIDAYKRTNLQ